MTEYYTTAQQQEMIERQARLVAFEEMKRQLTPPKSTAADRAKSLIERLTQSHQFAHAELSTILQQKIEMGKIK